MNTLVKLFHFETARERCLIVVVWIDEQQTDLPTFQPGPTIKKCRIHSSIRAVLGKRSWSFQGH